MGSDVLDIEEIDRTQVAVAGGKGANLGELSRMDGIVVPEGFCVTTDAFRRIIANAPAIDEPLDRLALLQADDRTGIRTLSAELRGIIEGIAIPDDVVTAITSGVARLGEHDAYAVRSSATAEDLSTASFAGQQDTFLNIVGSAAILEHVSRCWASLFTERAVTYRLRNGFDHRRVLMAVVVQRMVLADASGVVFTADPVTSNRKTAVVEACLGLGDALVSGLVNPDVYTVRGGAVVTRAVDPEHPALTDSQAVRVVQLARRIESHFGTPQDVEWCLADDAVHIVQSRPITTLFPVPVMADEDTHVYVSVGHQQMMTDAMKPLGWSLFQLTAARPMHEAGGRLFVDIGAALASPATRTGIVEALGNSEPLIGDALRAILARGDIVPALDDDGPAGTSPHLSAVAREPAPIDADSAIVAGLIQRNRASVAALQADLRTRSGVALIDFIVSDIAELKRILFDPLSHQVIMAGMEAAWWLNANLLAWLGEQNAADALSQSVPDNVTSEMGLALLDVADVIRPHPEVVAALQNAGDGFLDDLDGVPGGPAARDAIVAFLDMYGMRCAGEIDITRPRWSERPTTLVPLILGNVANFEPGAAAHRFERGQREAARREQQLIDRLRALPDGESKAAETKRMIDRVRVFAGYREYPKYGFICRYFAYKQSLLGEAERLVRTGVIEDVEDISFLTVGELGDVVRTDQVDRGLIRERKDAFNANRLLRPPRVMTSDGEVFAGEYRRDDVPTGALTGLAVSGGIIEGRARITLDFAEADLRPGDILVTAFTDPSWTPLFVTIAGLVTEVGGLMTHGAVIAREYGLPAVVCVEHATELIRDGQRIRVNGSAGYIEILDEPGVSAGP